MLDEESKWVVVGPWKVRIADDGSCAEIIEDGYIRYIIGCQNVARGKGHPVCYPVTLFGRKSSRITNSPIANWAAQRNGEPVLHPGRTFFVEWYAGYIATEESEKVGLLMDAAEEAGLIFQKPEIQS